MNRRGFFKSLGLALAAATVAPQVLLPRAPDAFKWQKTETGIYVINPEWVKAKYEIGFWWGEPLNIGAPPQMRPLMQKRFNREDGMPGTVLKCAYPIRLDDAGKIIPAFKKISCVG